MSINSALNAGVSGLIANSSALAAISDNISNVNTTAYKRHQVNFSPFVTSQAVGGRYTAGGVQGIPRTFVSTQGTVQSTDRSTDLAIAGDGFFVGTEKAVGLTTSDARKFTRAGSFSVDSAGFLVNDGGLFLQGWPALPGGGFAIDPSDLNRLQPINVRALGTAVQPTGNVGITANLNSATPVSAGEAGYNAALTSLADFAAGVPTGTAPDFTIDYSVVDSLGASHRFQIALLKDNVPNQWHAEIYAVPASDVVTAGPSGQLRAGSLNFNPDGSINLAASTLFVGPTVLNLGASASAATPRWAAGLGIAASSVNLDLNQISQVNDKSSVNTISNDGAGVGSVVGVQVDKQGVVSAIFDNSLVRQIAKVAIATFPNPDGLSQVNGNAYSPTLQAGPFVLKEAGEAGAGQVQSFGLEASTVDLSSEFTGLITTQKAYSASSKIITTADQMLSELINVIR